MYRNNSIQVGTSNVNFRQRRGQNANNQRSQSHTAFNGHTNRSQTNVPNVQTHLQSTASPSAIGNKKRLTNNQMNNEMRHYRRSILRTYKCPFKEEVGCKNETFPERCIFGHPTTSPGTLRDIPSYVCIFHLMNCCFNKSNRKCKNGLHLAIEDMLDLEHYQTTHTALIAKFNGINSNLNLDCAICFDRVSNKRVPKNRRFGILENCSHVFCASCIQTWRTRSDECPVCRTQSTRCLLRSKFVDAGQEKKKLFGPGVPHQSISAQPQEISLTSLLRSPIIRENFYLETDSDSEDYSYSDQLSFADFDFDQYSQGFAWIGYD